MVPIVEKASPMQPLIYTMFLVVYTFDFLRLQFGLPQFLLLMPEPEPEN